MHYRDAIWSYQLLCLSRKEITRNKFAGCGESTTSERYRRTTSRMKIPSDHDDQASLVFIPRDYFVPRIHQRPFGALGSWTWLEFGGSTESIRRQRRTPCVAPWLTTSTCPERHVLSLINNVIQASLFLGIRTRFEHPNHIIKTAAQDGINPRNDACACCAQVLQTGRL